MIRMQVKRGRANRRRRLWQETSREPFAKHRVLLSVNAKLELLNDPKNTTREKKLKVEKLENKAREAMGELKKAQQSAPKAIENRG